MCKFPVFRVHTEKLVASFPARSYREGAPPLPLPLLRPAPLLHVSKMEAIEGGNFNEKQAVTSSLRMGA